MISSYYPTVPEVAVWPEEDNMSKPRDTHKEKKKKPQKTAKEKKQEKLEKKKQKYQQFI